MNEQQDRPVEHNKFIRQRARSSYIGLLHENLPKNAWMDSTGFKSEPQRACICSQNRPLLSRNSANKLGSASINRSILQSLKENVDNLDVHERDECACVLNFQNFWNSQQKRKFRYEVNKWPRSAPHITFMEI